MATKKEREGIVPADPNEQKRIIQSAKSVQELDGIWGSLSAVGYASGGLTHQEVLKKRAELNGDPIPDFGPPPGADLPPIRAAVFPQTDNV